MKYVLMILLMISGTTYSEEVSKEYVQSSINKAALEVGIEPALLWSVCYSESSLKATAFVYNDGLHGNSAFGLCQVLYKTAVELGMKKDTGCFRDFRTLAKLKKLGLQPIPTGFVELKRDYKECSLFGPYTNALYAAKYLKKQMNRYKGSWISAIAAYNSGSLRVCESGRVHKAKDKSFLYTCEKGGLMNQKYVDRVLEGMQNYPYKGETNE